MAVLSKSTMFDPKVVADLVNKVKGHSSLATLSAVERWYENGASFNLKASTVAYLGK